MWLLGDHFLREIFDAYQAIKLQAGKGQSDDVITPYIQDYYNVRELYKSPFVGVKFASARVINNLTDAINQRKRLPKYLIVILDKDLILDINLDDENAEMLLREEVRWTVRNINTTLRRKKVDFLHKKPGSMTNLETTVIYVRMLCRVGSFSEDSTMNKVNQFRSKFNDALNDEVAKLDNRILTIASCNAYEHFDRLGNLSSLGKTAFWYELDDLIARFEENRVQLLANPKNPPNKKQMAKHSNNQYVGNRRRCE